MLLKVQFITSLVICQNAYNIQEDNSRQQAEKTGLQATVYTQANQDKPQANRYE